MERCASGAEPRVTSFILAVVEDFAFDGLISVVAIFPFYAAKVGLLEQQLQLVRLDLFFLLEQFFLVFGGLFYLWPASFILQSVILSWNVLF